MGVCFFVFFFCSAAFRCKPAKVRSASHIDPELLLNFIRADPAYAVAAVHIHTCIHPFSTAYKAPGHSESCRLWQPRHTPPHPGQPGASRRIPKTFKGLIRYKIRHTCLESRKTSRSGYFCFDFRGSHHVSEGQPPCEGRAESGKCRPDDKELYFKAQLQTQEFGEQDHYIL